VVRVRVKEGEIDITGERHARKWRKVGNTVVHRDASWKGESCTIRKREK